MAELLNPPEPQIRLLVCRKCKSVDEVPDYEGPVEGDALLERVVSKHQNECGAVQVGGETAEVASQQERFLVKVNRDHWNNERVRKEILNRLSMSGTGFEEKVYGVKNTWHADAMECYKRHKRPEQCIDYKDKSKRIGNGFLSDEEKQIQRASGLFTGLRQRRQQQTVFLCDFCLQGDTEVVTSTGIRPIRDLVGKAELLVPTTNRWDTPNTRGHFVEVDVKSFGVQSLFEVTLSRGPATKTVEATAEHRWLTEEGEHTTSSLTQGTRLRSLSATPYRGKAKRIDVAVAQGVVYGDGTCSQNDRRPAHLPIYDESKDKAFLQFFEWAPAVRYDDGRWKVSGLPRSWKNSPDLNESRSFLLSWLAGYFAADGTVNKKGAASIDSTSRESIDIVRSVAAVCGVRYGVVAVKDRVTELNGHSYDSTIYTLSLDVHTLPEWFWVVEQHRERVEERLRSTKAQEHPRGWVVQEVCPTGREEEVFCAVVPEVEAFALSDDLMTGNCPVKSGVQEKVFAKRGLYDD